MNILILIYRQCELMGSLALRVIISERKEYFYLLKYLEMREPNEFWSSNIIQLASG